MGIKSFVITIFGHSLSESSAKKCIQTAKDIGNLDVKEWKAITRYNSQKHFEKLNLKIFDESVFSWSYNKSALGCFLSHFYLWKHCVETNKRIMILEHDTVFTRRYEDVYFDGVLMIGEDVWKLDIDENSSHYKKINEKLYQWDCNCDHLDMFEENCDGQNILKCKLWGLKGTHSYVINPNTADKLIWKTMNRGITPADLFINRNNIKIGEIRPKVCYQEQKYSLIQNKKNKILVEKNVKVGLELWEKYYDS